MVLGGTNIDVYNNKGINNKCGIFVGPGLGATAVSFYNNVFLENVDYLIHLVASSVGSEYTFKNNILTGTGAQYYIYNLSTTLFFIISYFSINKKAF